MQILGGLGESYRSATSPLDLVEHVFDAGLLGQTTQLSGKVLLKRLPAPLSTTLKRRMHVVRNISYKHIHAYKMLAGCRDSARFRSAAIPRLALRSGSRLGVKPVIYLIRLTCGDARGVALQSGIEFASPKSTTPVLS